MSLMRLLGFATLPCGCVVGRYREAPTRREIVYVEEKGPACGESAHRRNHTVHSALPVMRPLAHRLLSRAS